MFERIKFKNKYPILAPYIKEKGIQKHLLKNNRFNKFYNEKYIEFQEIIIIYEEIYKENINEMLLKLIDIKDESTIQKVIQKTKLSYYQFKKYEVQFDTKMLDIESFIRINPDDLDLILDRLIFKTFIKDKHIINQIDLDDYFETLSNTNREKLLVLAKNIDLNYFFKNLKNKNLLDLFIKKLNSKNNLQEIYAKELIEELGNEEYNIFLEYYLNTELSNEENSSLNKILYNKKYELILLPLYIDNFKYTDIDFNKPYKDLFDLLNRKQIINLFNKKLKNSTKYEQYLYLKNAQKDALNIGSVNEVLLKYNNILFGILLKYKKTVEFMENVSYERIMDENISLDEIRNSYKNLQNTNITLMINNINQMICEIKRTYKLKYINLINYDMNNEKYKLELVNDSNSHPHLLKVLRLNGENFTFLTTSLEIETPNLYKDNLKGNDNEISCRLITENMFDKNLDSSVLYSFNNIEEEDIIKFNLDNLNKIKITKNDRVPNYIICVDKINDLSIKHARYFNIPVVVINSEVYNYISKEDNNLKIKK